MTNLESILADDPNLKLLSKTKLYAKLKSQGVTKSEVADFLNSNEITQIYSKPKKYKSLKITAPPYSFQMDVAHLPTYKQQNVGVESFLILVEILSRKAFLYVLKSGKMKDILQVYEKFLVDVGEVQVNSVAGDDFFNNKEFKEFNEAHLIEVYTDVAKDDHIVKGKGDKLGIVDRCIRTLKQYIQKYMLAHNNLKWTKFVGSLVQLYNDSPNQGIKDMTPDEVYDDVEYMQGLYKGQMKYNKRVNESFPFEAGDKVRAMMGKGVFEKEKARFSSEIYTVQGQVGYRFQLEDESGNLVKRKYRAGELIMVKGDVKDRLTTGVIKKAQEQHRVRRKVAHEHKQIDHVPIVEVHSKRVKEKKSTKFIEDVDGEDHTEIEKFVRKKEEDGKIYYYVKWSGYSAKHNEWKSEKDLKKELSSDAFRKFRGLLK